MNKGRKDLLAMNGGKPVRGEDRFLIYGQPRIEEDEIQEVVDSLRAGWLGAGPKVSRFEELFRKYKGTPHAIAVNSCTAALHLSTIAAGIKPGDEIITTAMTFCATTNAVIYSGAEPVLADADPVTWNIDPGDIEHRITDRTRAILVVHLGGRPCEMDAITAIARKHGLVLIEDCAHAIETEYKGRKAGTFGEFGCFSFYVTKNITTGEGGMVITPNEEMADRIKIMALHGMDRDAWKRFSDSGYRHYYVVSEGFKYNMMDMQAAIGIHQMGKIERYWKRRQDIWDIYMEEFKDGPFTLPAPTGPGSRHAYHLYSMLIDEKSLGMSRDTFLEAMTAEGIGVGVHYLSLPEHPYYREKLSVRPEDFPHAMEIGRRTVSLPLSAKLTDEDVKDVITAVRKTYRH